MSDLVKSRTSGSLPNTRPQSLSSYNNGRISTRDSGTFQPRTSSQPRARPPGTAAAPTPCLGIYMQIANFIKVCWKFASEHERESFSTVDYSSQGSDNHLWSTMNPLAVAEPQTVLSVYCFDIPSWLNQWFVLPPKLWRKKVICL